MPPRSVGSSARCHPCDIFDPAFLTDHPQYICPLDRGVSREAVRSRVCKHVYGLQCVLHWLLSNESCPSCRAPLDASQLEPVEQYRADIDEARVRCIEHSAPGRPCLWRGSLAALASHHHSSACSIHTVACPFCHHTHEAGPAFEAHKYVCPSALVMCPRCEEAVERARMPLHERTCTGTALPIATLRGARRNPSVARSRGTVAAATPTPKRKDKRRNTSDAPSMTTPGGASPLPKAGLGVHGAASVLFTPLLARKLEEARPAHPASHVSPSPIAERAAPHVASDLSTPDAARKTRRPGEARRNGNGGATPVAVRESRAKEATVSAAPNVEALAARCDALEVTVAALQDLVASQQRHIDFLLQHARQPQVGGVSNTRTGRSQPDVVSPIAPQHSSSRKRDRHSTRRKGRGAGTNATFDPAASSGTPLCSPMRTPPKVAAARAISPARSSAPHTATATTAASARATTARPAAVASTGSQQPQPVRQPAPYRESAWSATSVASAVATAAALKPSTPRGAGAEPRAATSSCAPAVQELLRMRTGHITFDDVLRAASARGPSTSGRIGGSGAAPLAPQMPTSAAPITARPRTRESQPRFVVS